MTLVFFTGRQVHVSQSSYVNVLGEQSTTQGLLPVGIGVEEIQTILLQCGTYAEAVQSVINSLDFGDQFSSIQILTNKLTENIQSVQSVINSLPVSKEQIQAIRNVIIEDVITSIQTINLELRQADIAQDIQLLSQYIGNYPVMFETTSRTLYLDGKDITKRVTRVNIDYSESSVHNTITLWSLDKDLFHWSDPFYLQGASRFEIHIGSRVMYFLLEKRSGTERNFEIWGRSLSARDDLPFAEEISYSLSEPKSAKEVAELLPTYSLVDWQCDDWVLPDTFEFRGTPIEGILKIAGVADVIVRCKDDGSIEIRNKFPIRPVDMNGSTATLSFDRNTVIEGLTYAEEQGEGYNQIEVYGADSSNKAVPELVLENSRPVQGEDTVVRVYWSNIAPPDPNTMIKMVTDGSVVTSGIITEIKQETIEFNSGVGNLDYPITVMIDHEWIGIDLGGITSTKYKKELTAAVDGDTNGYGIATITYETQYRKYILKGHNVEKLIFILSNQIGNNVDVIIKSVGINDTDFYEAPIISDPLITDKNIAVIRGRNWLDEHKYDTKIFNIRTPYRDALLDGILIFLNDGEIGCSGNFYVKNSTIILDGPKIINELEVIQWQV